jgi:hypothetical protein
MRARILTISPSAPEGDAFPVGRQRPWCQKIVHQPVAVFEELPSETTLANPTHPHDGDKARSSFLPSRVKGIFEQTHFLVAAYKGRLESLGSTKTSVACNDVQGSIRLDGQLLAFDGVFARVLEADRLAGRPVGCLPPPGRLQARQRFEDGPLC